MNQRFFVVRICRSTNDTFVTFWQSPDLQVVLSTPERQPETYIRSLQAKETLYDIRKWTAKAWLVEKCSVQKLQWLMSLRFFHDGEFLSLEEEKLEPAALCCQRSNCVPWLKQMKATVLPNRSMNWRLCCAKSCKHLPLDLEYFPTLRPRFHLGEPRPSWVLLNFRVQWRCTTIDSTTSNRSVAAMLCFAVIRLQ